MTAGLRLRDVSQGEATQRGGGSVLQLRQQPFVTSARQLPVKFVHSNVAEFCVKTPKYHVVLLTALVDC